jgi:APA family basic amino acid/polyamine antiporter
VPAVYVLGAAVVVLCLFIDRPATTWPGLALVIAGLPVYFLIRRATAQRN